VIEVDHAKTPEDGFHLILTSGCVVTKDKIETASGRRVV
jgi:hypothetical protein